MFNIKRTLKGKTMKKRNKNKIKNDGKYYFSDRIRSQRFSPYVEMVIDAMEKAKNTNYKWTSGLTDSLVNNGWPVRMADPTGENWTHYNGINVFTLSMHMSINGFKSNKYATDKAWYKLGSNVKIKDDQKGNATDSLYWFRGQFEKETDPNDGKEKDVCIRKPCWKCYFVYNRDQMEGLPEEKKPLIMTTQEIINSVPLDNKIKMVEKFLNAQNVTLKHSDQGAFYNIDQDFINMPHKDHYVGTSVLDGEQTYYSTLLHEHVHATGAKKRLNRKHFRSKDKSKTYAEEELVAEIGSAIACSQLGIITDPSNQLNDHGAYLNGWIKSIKEKEDALIWAFHNAIKAYKYMESNYPKDAIFENDKVA